ncbi:MAG: filamentation induced by cAMP protein Fic [Alphaproteobacteria bacterium]|nr:filamentation induced by cAMP protein Fic [Alphaproteobacteria bacterium]
MATQGEKLATSRKVLADLIRGSNRTVFRSTEFSRVHRERLGQAGFLIEIIKGWLLVADPTKRAGESTLWYANFWNFLSVFLEERFGSAYCLSAESSLALHVGSPTIPTQVTAITERPSGQTVGLPFSTSLFLYQDAKNLPQVREIKNGLQAMALPEAICRLTKTFFVQHPVEAGVALSLVSDPGQLLHFLLLHGQTTMAGYLVGAYRQWFHYRKAVVDAFPAAPGLPHDPMTYLSTVDEHYVNDAYNSLSIEGYQVSPALIEKVYQGAWDPVENPGDASQRDALAAKGYHLAFEAVRTSLQRVLNGDNPGVVVKEDLPRWYTALFSPSVQAGILQGYHLAGYRSQQVYIQNSRHVPFPQNALLDSMDMLFDLLEREESPAVRAVLGHFFFVHIHPYSDGNGRLGRFLMNVMMASGGYPWTIIPVARRAEYMNALEQASCEDNIFDFVDFIKSLGFE